MSHLSIQVKRKMSSLARKHRVTAARLAAMHGQACVPVRHKTMNLLPVFRKQTLLIKEILAPIKLIGRIDAATWLYIWQFRSTIFFSGHVPCNFIFYSDFFRKGRGWEVKIGSICV